MIISPSLAGEIQSWTVLSWDMLLFSQCGHPPSPLPSTFLSSCQRRGRWERLAWSYLARLALLMQGRATGLSLPPQTVHWALCENLVLTCLPLSSTSMDFLRKESGWRNTGHWRTSYPRETEPYSTSLIEEMLFPWMAVKRCGRGSMARQTFRNFVCEG